MTKSTIIIIKGAESLEELYYVACLCVQEELVSIRRKFDSGDVIEHLSRKIIKTRAKRVR